MLTSSPPLWPPAAPAKLLLLRLPLVEELGLADRQSEVGHSMWMRQLWMEGRPLLSLHGTTR